MKINKEKLEKSIKYVIIAMVVASLMILGFSKGSGNEIIINGKETNLEYYNVEVIGEVKRPGIYQVENGSCISDIIRLSGGLTKVGTLEGINTATKITEGMRIIVSSKTEATNKICINSCDVEDLINLGLSKSKAQSIINYRRQKTWISYLDEITKISGITDSDYNQIKEFVIL